MLIVIFCGSLDLATDVADEIGQASGGKPTNGIGFLPNCRLVAWDVVGELRDCIPMMPPRAAITPRAMRTDRMTAGARPIRVRRMRSASGARTKLSRIARVIGTRTSRPKYSAATMTTVTARVVRPRRLGVSAGTTWAHRGPNGGVVSGMSLISRFKRQGRCSVEPATLFCL